MSLINELLKNTKGPIKQPSLILYICVSEIFKFASTKDIHTNLAQISLVGFHRHIYTHGRTGTYFTMRQPATCIYQIIHRFKKTKEVK